MDKGKYLIYFLLGFFLNFIVIKALANSAWFPHKGHYKVGISNATINKRSLKRKSDRVRLFQEIERRIDPLITELTLVSDPKAYYHKYNVVLTEEEIKAIKKFLINKINKYKSYLQTLNPYQQNQISNAFVEYAPRNNISFGIEAYYKENIFTNSKYTSSKYRSTTESVSLFYKHKIAQRKNLILSVQPKIILNNHSDFKREEIFHEISFLAGLNKKMGKIEFFTQGAVTFGGGSSSLSVKKKYYNFEYSEGVKLPYGISLVNYSKHYIRLNHGFGYGRNIYQQLSVAKKIQFGNLGSKNITVQFGYFRDYNPRYSAYNMSGTIFSLWSEI